MPHVVFWSFWCRKDFLHAITYFDHTRYNNFPLQTVFIYLFIYFISVDPDKNDRPPKIAFKFLDMLYY